MAKSTEYIIMGPPTDVSRDTPSSSSESRTSRTEAKSAAPNLRTLYRLSAQQDEHASMSQSIHSASTVLQTSPQLPPTPPGAPSEDLASYADETASEAAAFRSTLVTPSNPNSPPTPDNTPPCDRTILFVRPFLETQPSIGSTRAESFRTAREDLTSEDESDSHALHREPPPPWVKPGLGAGGHRLRHSALPPSPLMQSHEPASPHVRPPDQFIHADFLGPYVHDKPMQLNRLETDRCHANPSPLGISSPTRPDHSDLAPVALSHDDAAASNADVVANNHVTPAPPTPPAPTREEGGTRVPRRDKSLRDRLREAQTPHLSASTEKFATIIGWNEAISSEDASPPHLQPGADADADDVRRFSGVSATSTIEAFVLEPMTPPKRVATLRHVEKHDSLRSFSMPLPSPNRQSIQSTSDSAHRQLHKKVKMTNMNRWSYGSEVSRSYSLASSAALPRTEVIRVAVIPERKSSLASSPTDSQRQSLSLGSAQSESRKTWASPPSSWQRKRTVSDANDRGRSLERPPVVPPRSSSLSAPTSKSTSRANSVTSEHLRVRRQQAESDLRRTLDKMEMLRLVQNMQDVARASDHDVSQVHGLPLGSASTSQTPTQIPAMPVALDSSLEVDGPATGNAFGLAVPGTAEWAALRPSSSFDTPFSLPSFQSASPEIIEARTINYFPHHNDSLQLIEPFAVAESRAVREVQRRQLPQAEADSPLRHPRRPPEPPEFKLTPPTPGGELDRRVSGEAARSTLRTSSVRRSHGSQRRRADSLMGSITRNLSLKTARNRKADQDLDGSLHPMWRPRAFWDDGDHAPVVAPPESGERGAERGLVNNSLGLPQERIVVTGPLSLVRRISERRRARRGVVRQASHGSLAKLRATHRFHTLRLLPWNFRLMGWKELQERILHAKQRKDDERRERRRADLRRSIGANVVPTGDSRFPASDTSLSRQ